MKSNLNKISSDEFFEDNSQIITQTSRSRFLGALFIVAGTTVGAGMLALPMTSSQLGFVNSILLLVGMWVFTCFAALVTVEINLRVGGGYSIAYLSEKTFGKTGKYIASISMGMLFYSLISAYTAGGASFFKMGVESIVGISLPFPAMAVAFVTTLGMFVYSSMRHVDFANRFLLFFKTTIFCGLVYCLAPFVTKTNLISSGAVSNNAWWLAIPIFFTSFGFHGSIPSLINYVGPHPKDLKKIIIIGSAIPLAIYILWQIVTLGVVSSNELQNNSSKDVAAFVTILNHATNNNVISYFSNIFAFFGVSTSFLGVAIGLFDYLAETFKRNSSSSQKLQTATLTFLPPLFFALFFPNGFILALGYAAIALSVLAVILPTLIALKQKPIGVQTNKTTLNNLVLLATLTAGIVIVLIELFKN